MTSWAAHARVEEAPVSVPRGRPRRPQPQTRARAKQQHKVASGVLWIAVFGVLLAGVVAINVAVLRENVTLNHLTKSRGSLRADNADLLSKISTQLSVGRVQTAARRQGFVPALPGDTSYVAIAAHAK
jgi:hypothetical protein